MAQEFLPLCDVLFNIISLASYFCDVVFDVVTIYTLYEHQEVVWFTLSLSCVLLSLVVCQLCSFKWYLSSLRKDLAKKDCDLSLMILLHFFQGGVLWRYFKLFIPVDLRYVKHEVRDLCMLRLIHAFCEAAPMLLIQLYLIWRKPSLSELTDLNIVSTALSLFSVCWALASFNKNVRRHNVHRLVLTWLGVIFQFVWRLGTITSRSIALTVYATLYGYWVFLVIALHWVSMFLWLISPKNVFHGEKMPMFKKVIFSMLIAFCYIFCYINLQEINARQKMVAFYITMLLENALLIAVWLGGLRTQPWYQHPVTALVFVAFGFGILFMILYYQHFHVKRLKHNYTMSSSINAYSSCTGCQLGQCTDKSHRMPFPYYLNELSASDNSTIASNTQQNGTAKLNNLQNIETRADHHSNPSSHPHPYPPDALHVPGVFNCRFNPGIKRKKKKPTSFVPPPVPVIPSLAVPNNSTAANNNNNNHNNNNGRVVPFWKRPLPQSISSDHEGSVGSRVNIQQKLQEKKQQQIAELRQIEEEIKAGKLKRPHPSDISESGTLRQPIPRSKKQPWLKPEPPLDYPYLVVDASAASVPAPAHRKQRSQTPEILLAPHYLDNTRIYYDYQDPRWKYGNNYHLPSDDMSGSSHSKRSTKRRNRKADKNSDNRDKVIYKSYRIPSDLDSQISLPRSYTLPREFKYYRRPKSRKAVRSDHFMASTNSSDGDVDSCDEGDLGESMGRLNNAVHFHINHNHHHHYHHHSFLHNHHTNHVAESPPHPQHPLRARIHAAFHRNLANTHETKL
ncbi:uncharacterized protein LOC122250694 [Penaeus japonicus]|uniref:uncharacterized protein LOC122250694 n=1 Tax=Penaeus japonicus TaxID=27405 RepID=UPI001C70F195|nr:uncharacterized protein LOC122250694 [Penaeus japonicus]XP_042868183.1 uncharacterized protein LOC122250694 [Penaeus japonicus]